MASSGTKRSDSAPNTDTFCKDLSRFHWITACRTSLSFKSTSIGSLFTYNYTVDQAAQAVQHHVDAIRALFLQEALHILLELTAVAAAGDILHLHTTVASAHAPRRPETPQEVVLLIGARGGVDLRAHEVRIPEAEEQQQDFVGSMSTFITMFKELYILYMQAGRQTDVSSIHISYS